MIFARKIRKNKIILFGLVATAILHPSLLQQYVLLPVPAKILEEVVQDVEHDLVATLIPAIEITDFYKFFLVRKLIISSKLNYIFLLTKQEVESAEQLE